MDIPYEKTMVEIFRWRVERSSDQIVHKFEEKETTYKELDSFSNKVAQGLIEEGCEHDSRVAYLGKNSDLFFEFMYGTIKSRTVTVGVNWRLAPPEVAFILNDSKSEILFVGPEFFGLIEEIKEEIPSVRKIITMGGHHEEWEDYLSWRDSQLDEDPMLDSKGDDDVIQLYTSGTTGHPKGVQLTNDNFSACFMVNEVAMYRDMDEGGVNLVCMPIFHVAGTNMGIAGMVTGAKSIIIPEVDPGLILKLIEQERIQHTIFVPAVILFLIQHPDSATADFSSLETVIYGASPITDDTLKKAMELMDCNFWQVYGLTETNGAITFLYPEDHEVSRGKLRSCGKAAKGVGLRVVDSEDNDVPIGEVGEVIIKSDLNMKGYWNRPEATDEAIKDGWFYSGDVGYFDDEGFLYIHDRVKDMIVSGGENIYPAEVENALMSHGEILDAAVIGVPDEKWGEAVKAFVVLSEGSKLEEIEIISYVRTQVAAYKCPKTINFVSELPRNPSGKILRREIRAPFWEGRDRNISGN
ncbi:MAG: long-chain-fatty-acid--CoA ligase [Gammaproteobacteria bacterium]